MLLGSDEKNKPGVTGVCDSVVPEHPGRERSSGRRQRPSTQVPADRRRLPQDRCEELLDHTNPAAGVANPLLISTLLVSSRNLPEWDCRGRGGPVLRAPGGHASLGIHRFSSLGDPQRGKEVPGAVLRPLGTARKGSCRSGLNICTSLDLLAPPTDLHQENRLRFLVLVLTPEPGAPQPPTPTAPPCGGTSPLQGSRAQRLDAAGCRRAASTQCGFLCTCRL